MNLELGSIAELLGALGVIVTLGYLVVQIRRNTLATRSQTAQGTFQHSFEVVQTLMEAGNFDVWARLMGNGIKSFDPVERPRANMLARITFTSYDNHLHQYLQGNLDQEIHDAYTRRLQQLLQTPGLRARAEENLGLFTESFQRHLVSHMQRAANQDGGSVSPPSLTQYYEMDVDSGETDDKVR